MSKVLKESVTFRLNSPNLSALSKESKRRGVSLNTLVSQIIDRHVDWHSHAAEANLVSVQQIMITKLLSKYTDLEIEEIAQNVAKHDVKDVVLLLRKKNDAESFLDLIETWAKVSDFPYSHSVDDTIHEFFLQHDMGKQLSKYLSKLYETMFESFGLKKVEFDITNKSISFTVDTKKPR